MYSNIIFIYSIIDPIHLYYNFFPYSISYDWYLRLESDFFTPSIGSTAQSIWVLWYTTGAFPMMWSALGVVIPALDKTSVCVGHPPVNRTYGTEKNEFLHLRTCNLPQKIWQPFENLKLKNVIDKTCVGSAVFAFHGRNRLPTNNLKAEYLECCLWHGHEPFPS